VGGEDANYGHVGNDADCMGCHGNTATLSESTTVTGEISPQINRLSITSITAGLATPITISGSAFTNLDRSGNVLSSNVQLTGADGSKTTLIPESITEDTITTTVPATMAPGNYAVTVVKKSSKSARVNLSLIPPVAITTASCVDGVVNISGSGFGQYVNAINSGTSVSLPNIGGCSVVSWTDTAIKANCGTCANHATVDSVYGEAEGIVVVKKSVAKKRASVK
jgi:hypothetical protein